MRSSHSAMSLVFHLSRWTCQLPRKNAVTGMTAAPGVRERLAQGIGGSPTQNHESPPMFLSGPDELRGVVKNRLEIRVIGRLSKSSLGS